MPPEIGIHPDRRIIRQKAEGDVACTEKAETQGTARAVCRQNDVAGDGISLHTGNRTGEDPGMALPDGLCDECRVKDVPNAYDRFKKPQPSGEDDDDDDGEDNDD